MDKKTNDFMTELRDQIAAKDAAQDAQLADIMIGKPVTTTRSKPQSDGDTPAGGQKPAKKPRKKAAPKAAPKKS